MTLCRHNIQLAGHNCPTDSTTLTLTLDILKLKDGVDTSS